MKPGWVLGLFLAVLVLLRFTLFNEYLSFGSDMGSYLQTRNWVLGLDPIGPTTPHFRPPLIGIFLVPFTTLLGDMNGGKALSLLLSIAPAIPMYFLARIYVRPWLAVLAALALVLNPQNALNSALNQITLPAMAFAIWGLLVMAKLQRGEGKPWHLAPPVVLMAGINQTVSGIFALMALAFFLTSPSRQLARALGLATVACLPWLWFYLPSTPIANGHFVPGANLNIIPQWTTLLLFVPVFLVFLLSPRQMLPWWAVALILTFAAQIVVAEEAINNVFQRGMRFVSIFTILALAITAEILSGKVAALKLRLQRVAVLPLLALLVWGNSLWFSTFRNLADYYEFITPDSLQALNWLKDNTSSEAKILAYPEALGWYIGGVVPRKWAGISGRGTALAAFARVNEATITAMGWPGAGPGAGPGALGQEGIDYVVVDRNSWQTFNGPDWEALDTFPWFVKEAQFGTVGIYRLEAE